MNYRIHNLNRPIDSEPAFYEEAIEKMTGLKKGSYTWRRHRESIDARKGRTMQFTATIDIVTEKKLKTNKKLRRFTKSPTISAPLKAKGGPLSSAQGPPAFSALMSLRAAASSPLF